MNGLLNDFALLWTPTAVPADDGWPCGVRLPVGTSFDKFRPSLSFSPCDPFVSSGWPQIDEFVVLTSGRFWNLLANFWMNLIELKNISFKDNSKRIKSFNSIPVGYVEAPSSAEPEHKIRRLIRWKGGALPSVFLLSTQKSNVSTPFISPSNEKELKRRRNSQSQRTNGEGGISMRHITFYQSNNRSSAFLFQILWSAPICVAGPSVCLNPVGNYSKHFGQRCHWNLRLWQLVISLLSQPCPGVAVASHSSIETLPFHPLAAVISHWFPQAYQQVI